MQPALYLDLSKASKSVPLREAKKVYPDLPPGGVWRTIRGNRVYIVNGEIVAGIGVGKTGKPVKLTKKALAEHRKELAKREARKKERAAKKEAASKAEKAPKKQSKTTATKKGTEKAKAALDAMQAEKEALLKKEKVRQKKSAEKQLKNATKELDKLAKNPKPKKKTFDEHIKESRAAADAMFGNVKPLTAKTSAPKEAKLDTPKQKFFRWEGKGYSKRALSGIPFDLGNGEEGFLIDEGGSYKVYHGPTGSLLATGISGLDTSRYATEDLKKQALEEDMSRVVKRAKEQVARYKPNEWLNMQRDWMKKNGLSPRYDEKGQPKKQYTKSDAGKRTKQAQAAKLEEKHGKFYIAEMDGGTYKHIHVPGAEPVDIHPDFEFFYHKDGKEHQIREASTGLAVARADSKTDAIQKAKELVEKNKDRMKQVIQVGIQKTGGTPRYHDKQKQQAASKAPKASASPLLEDIAKRSKDALDFFTEVQASPEALKEFKARISEMEGKSTREKMERLFKELGGSEREYRNANPGDPLDFSIGDEDPTLKKKKYTLRFFDPNKDTGGGEAQLKTIYFTRNILDMDDKKALSALFLHEYAHTLANRFRSLAEHILKNPQDFLGRTNVKKQRFESALPKELQIGGMYDLANPEEAFADAYAAYYTNPNLLKKQNPDIYRFIETLIQKIPNHDKELAAVRKQFSDFIQREKKKRSQKSFGQKGLNDMAKLYIDHTKSKTKQNTEKSFGAYNRQTPMKGMKLLDANTLDIINKSAVKEYPDLPPGGVWRTIRGRRVYIKNGTIVAGAFQGQKVAKLGEKKGATSNETKPKQQKPESVEGKQKRQGNARTGSPHQRTGSRGQESSRNQGTTDKLRRVDVLAKHNVKPVKTIQPEAGKDQYTYHLIGGEAGARAFHEAIVAAKEGNSHGAFVHAYTKDEYTEQTLFLSDGGEAGFAVKKDGDIVSVFHNPKIGTKKGVAGHMLKIAIQHGGKKLDCFDGFLPKLYSKYGFVPVARLKFNREYAPEGWNYERDGEPDVIFFAHNGDSIEKINATDYPPPDMDKVPYVDDYDEGVRLQQEYLNNRTLTKSLESLRAFFIQ